MSKVGSGPLFPAVHGAQKAEAETPETKHEPAAKKKKNKRHREESRAPRNEGRDRLERSVIAEVQHHNRTANGRPEQRYHLPHNITPERVEGDHLISRPRDRQRGLQLSVHLPQIAANAPPSPASARGSPAAPASARGAKGMPELPPLPPELGARPAAPAKQPAKTEAVSREPPRPFPDVRVDLGYEEKKKG